MNFLRAHPGWILLALIAAAAALRLILVFAHEGFLGVDGGAYLLIRNEVLGDEPTGASFPKPPLAPGWLLVPFTAALGDDQGYKLFSAVGSMLLLIPGAYLLSRAFLTLWQTNFALSFLMVDMMHGEMIVTGVLPLMGFGLLALALWGIHGLAEGHSWRRGLAILVALPLIAFINQTTAGMALVVLPVYMAALAYFGGAWRERLLRMVPWVAGGGLLALTALPWYLDVLPVSGELRYPGPYVYFDGIGSFAWWQFALGGLLAFWMVRFGQDYRIRALGAVTGLLAIGCTLLSTDETVINVFYRSRYLLSVPFFIGVTWVVFRYWWPSVRPAYGAYGLTLVALGLMAFGYVWQFNGQARYSDMATPEVVAALELLEEREDGIVTNAYTLALWIAALNKAPVSWTFTHEPPALYVEADRDVRCVLGWVEGCDVVGAAGRLQATHVLIDERFPNYNKRAPATYLAPADQWKVTGEAPWLEPIFSSGTVKLWRIRHAT